MKEKKNMKKIVLTAIVALLGFSANAQVIGQTVRSTSSHIERQVTVEPKSDRKTHVLRLGMNFGSWVGEDLNDDHDWSSAFGYDFIMATHRKMGNSGAYWAMEYGLSTRGYKYEGDGYVSGYGSYDYSKKLLAHNIYFSPFTFGWKIQAGDVVRIDPHVGMWMSVDYAGSETFELDGEEESESIWDLEDDYIPVDAGIKVGVGVWFNRFNLDFSYQRGFVPVIEEADVYTSNFKISLGIEF